VKLGERRHAAGDEAPVSRTAGPSTVALAPCLSVHTTVFGRARKPREKVGRRRTERGRGTTRRKGEGGATAGGARQGHGGGWSEAMRVARRKGEGAKGARRRVTVGMQQGERRAKKSQECSTPSPFAHCAEPGAASAGGATVAFGSAF
jgi:hypothetical protein